MTKYIVIGRHKFTDKQVRILEKVGLTEEIERIAKLEDINSVVQKAKENNAVILVQALPMHILAQLLSNASRNGIEVYAFKIEAVTTVGINEKCPEECDIEIPDPRSGNKRCSKTVALQRLKRIIVEAEDVATL